MEHNPMLVVQYWEPGINGDPNVGITTQQKLLVYDTVLVTARCDTDVFAVLDRYCSCSRSVSDLSGHTRISSV